ncbi:MAG TPA: DUF1579 family protein [Myxococcota bacterium]|jgi:hypothetical protein|nr:DUF1579 family protein [Myxococcota bacterium]
MKTVLATVAGIAGLIALLSFGFAADKPADKPASAGAKPSSAAPTPAPAAAAGMPAMAGEPVAPPKPGAEHDVLKWFVGTWKCTGKMEASPMGPAHAVEGTMTTKATWGGLYYEGNWAEKKTKENPFPMKGRSTSGYDLMGKVYTMTWISSFGEQMLAMSKGWEGDKWSWTAEGAMGPGSKWTETDTKVSDKEFTLSFDMTMGGKTTPAGSMTCKK